MHTKARVTAGLAVVAAVICSPIAARGETALEALAAGEKLFNQWHDSEAALPLFERAVALDPELAMPHYYLCRIRGGNSDAPYYDASRIVPEGEAFLRLADPDDPAQREAMIEMLEFLMGRNRRPSLRPKTTADQRLAWYRQLVELAGLEEYGAGLVWGYIETGEYEKAVATADDVLKVVTDPGHRGNIERNRMRAFVRTPQGKQELAARERAVAESPDDPDAHLGLADLYSALGRHDDALKENTRAAQLGAAEGYVRLARSHAWTQPKLAAQECLAALRIEPGNWRAAGLMVSGTGIYSDGRNRYHEGLVPHVDLDAETLASLMWNPEHSGPYTYLARIYLQRGDAASAERMAWHALEGGVKPRLVCKLLVDCYLKLGRQDEINALVRDLAGRAGDEASDAISDAVDALLRDGEAWPDASLLIADPRLTGEQRARMIERYAHRIEQSNRRADAIAFIERELASPQRASIPEDKVEHLYARLFGYYRESRDPEGALAAGRRYVEEFPQSGRAYHRLGQLTRDDPAAAEAAYRRALELLPIGGERAGTQRDLARLLMSEGRDEEAVRLLQDACRWRWGDRFEPRLALAEALLNLGRIEDAEQALEVALDNAAHASLYSGSLIMERLVAVFQRIEGEGDVNARLEAELAKHPDVWQLAQYLMEQYVAQRRFADVTRLGEQYGGPTGPASGLKKRAAELLREAKRRDEQAARLWESVLRNLEGEKWRADQLSRDCVAAWRAAGSLEELRTKTTAALAEHPDSVVLKLIAAEIGDHAPAPD